MVVTERWAPRATVLREREVAAPLGALVVGAVLLVGAGAFSRHGPALPLYAPLIDAATIGCLLVVAFMSVQDVMVRRHSAALPIAGLALALGVLWLPHMLTFPTNLAHIDDRSAQQTAAVLFDVAQLATPALLVLALCQPSGDLPNPSRAVRAMLVRSVGFGLVCSGLAVLIAPVMPPFTVGLRFTPAHTILQSAALATTAVAAVLFLVGRRADRRLELGLVAAIILLTFGNLSSLFPTSIFDGRWYLANLLHVLPVGALMVGQLTLYGDTVTTERRRVRHLELLQHITHDIVASLQTEQVMGEVVSSAVEAVSASRGVKSATAVMLRIEGGAATVMAQGSSDGAPLVSTSFSLEASGTLSAAVESGVARECSRRGRRRSGNMATEPLFGPTAGWIAYAPVRAGGELLGAIGVATYGGHPRDPEILKLIEGVADLAGLAATNAREHQVAVEAAGLDFLTGLPGPRHFERVLNDSRTDAFAILAVDIDHLKAVNDQYGHLAGDQVLKTFARSLQSGFRGHDVVARLGGDEFGVLLPSATADEAAAVADRIRLTLRGLDVPFGAKQVSIGYAAGAPRTDPRDVLGRAYEALDHAKKKGRDRVEGFGGLARDEAASAKAWTDVIRGMLQPGGITTRYQPIVSLTDGTLAGYEALARPADGGDASVETLFATATRIGLGSEIDWFSRRAAVDGAREVKPGAQLFINVSIPALLDPLHDVDQMKLLLQWAGRSPSEVVLEISEREAVADMARLGEVLDAYRTEGFRFAVDDVGEGHSTLELLAMSRPEFIKIARSLVSASGEAGPRAAMQALVTFARSTGASVVAEGLETDEQIGAVRAMGVELGQGYRLGRPELLRPGRPADEREDEATGPASERRWAEWMARERIGGLPAAAPPVSPSPSPRDVPSESTPAAGAEADALKSEFLMTVSHELRTPLTVIIGYADLLARDLTDVQAESANEIRTAAGRLSRLVEDILEMSHLEAGELQLHTAPVDMAAVVEAVVEEFKPAAQSKGLTLEVEPPDGPILVHADADLIRQCVWHLVSNAVKFTEEGGAVVSCTPLGEEVIVIVQDTGIGIGPEAVDVIFDKFRQGDQRISRRFGGAGLGLAIAKRLVELQGGRLGVESSAEGSSFWFTVPAHSAQ